MNEGESQLEAPRERGQRKFKAELNTDLVSFKQSFTLEVLKQVVRFEVGNALGPEVKRSFDYSIFTSRHVVYMYLGYGVTGAGAQTSHTGSHKLVRKLHRTKSVYTGMPARGREWDQCSPKAQGLGSRPWVKALAKGLETRPLDQGLYHINSTLEESVRKSRATTPREAPKSYKVDKLGIVDNLADSGSQSTGEPLRDSSRGRAPSRGVPAATSRLSTKHYTTPYLEGVKERSRARSRLHAHTHASAARSVNYPDGEGSPSTSTRRHQGSATNFSISPTASFSPSSRPRLPPSSIATRFRSPTKLKGTEFEGIFPKPSTQPPLARPTRLVKTKGMDSFEVQPPLEPIMTDIPASSPLPSLTDEKTSQAPQSSPQRSQSPVDSEEEMNPMASEMEKLQIEYTQDRKLDVSTALRIAQLANKVSLERGNLLDHGVSSTKEYLRFSITADFSILLETTILEMQSLLDRAGHLVPHRRNIFVVDPRNSLISILRGSESLDELNVSWVALSKRLGLAHKYLEKYGREFKNDPLDPAPNSPVSTTAGLYNRMPMDEGNQSQLSFLFHNVFHHREQIPTEFRDRAENWVNRALPAPEGLHQAFPERDREENPSTIYYSATGTKMEQFSSDRSSWRKNGEEFDLPPVGSKDKGKGATPNEKPKDSVRFQEQLHPRVYTENEDVPSSPRRASRAAFAPNSDLPHPLRGLASAGPYPNYGDSVPLLSICFGKDFDRGLLYSVSAWKAEPRG
ncbi:hypothetical protein C8R46DRAFT_1295118 [Mycena filopes]|nr:hypothetical protein C8R46DRAFT_1295118 [Mycena filopes]